MNRGKIGPGTLIRVCIFPFFSQGFTNRTITGMFQIMEIFMLSLVLIY